MGNGYTVPPQDELDQLRQILLALQQRLRELEAPDGSQLFNAVQELRNLVDNLATEIQNVSASGATWQGPVSSGSGNIITSSGDVYTPHGRSTPVVTSYVAAYLNSDGRLGATPSARRFKRDMRPKVYTLEQVMAAQIVEYRLRALVGKLGDDAPSEVGVIAEQLVHAGLAEFVVYNEDGRPFSVAYERLSILALAGVQQMYSRIQGIEERLSAAGL